MTSSRVFRTNDLANLLTAARAGLGLAVLPCIMAHSAPDLVSVPTRLPPLTRERWLLFHRDIGRSPAVRAVIDRITAITAAARGAFLGQQAAGRVVDPVIPWKRGLPLRTTAQGFDPCQNDLRTDG
jgi:hypothetical protein